MKKITLAATVDNVDAVTDFVNEELEAFDCPMKVSMQIAIAVEEIFVNIAHYAYDSGEGEATITCSVEGDPLYAEIQFMDRGKPYDPLSKEDPDITLGVDERGMVTAGGVSLDEIDMRTMRAKRFDGLYVIGEALDADGITGGYNLQLCWSTAAAAADDLRGDE